MTFQISHWISQNIQEKQSLIIINRCDKLDLIELKHLKSKVLQTDSSCDLICLVFNCIFCVGMYW